MKPGADPESKKKTYASYLAVDDGFYYLHAVEVDLPTLLNSGVAILPRYAQKSDSLYNYRLLFGSVTDDSSVESFIALECSEAGTGDRWVPCDAPGDANQARMEALLNRLIPE